MKLILRLIGLKMSILRVDAAIINPKTVKPNGWPEFLVGWGNGIVTRKYMKMGWKSYACGRKEP